MLMNDESDGGLF